MISRAVMVLLILRSSRETAPNALGREASGICVMKPRSMASLATDTPS
jgi:hypothetical protein